MSVQYLTVKNLISLLSHCGPDATVWLADGTDCDQLARCAAVMELFHAPLDPASTLSVQEQRDLNTHGGVLLLTAEQHHARFITAHHSHSDEEARGPLSTH